MGLIQIGLFTEQFMVVRGCCLNHLQSIELLRIRARTRSIHISGRIVLNAYLNVGDSWSIPCYWYHHLSPNRFAYFDTQIKVNLSAYLGLYTINDSIQHPNMHALIIGGSGRTGKLVVNELLRRGKIKQSI